MTSFHIPSLKTDAGTQFRSEMSKSQVEGLSDLISRNVKWKTPVQIATHDGTNYLTDGFHRVEAYKALGIEEIPAGQFEIIECATMDDVFMLSIRANASHGNKNTVEERLLMMNKLIQMDSKRYMPNRWEVSLTAIAEALQIPKGQARTVVQPKNEALKQERSAEINRLHKEGKSNGEIDTLLELGKDFTRRFLLKQSEQAKEQDQSEQIQNRWMETLNAEATSGGVQNDVHVMLARKDAEIAHLRAGQGTHQLLTNHKERLEINCKQTLLIAALRGMTSDELAVGRKSYEIWNQTKEETEKARAEWVEINKKYAHVDERKSPLWDKAVKNLNILEEKARGLAERAKLLPAWKSALQEYDDAFDTYRDVIAKAIANKATA